jgi:hypothetical protein
MKPIHCGVLFAAALFACHHERTPDQGTTMVTGANVPSVTNATAVSRIAEARCAREHTCNNIGSGKSYISHEACTDKLRASTADDLNANDCPAGISERDLDGCVTAIKSENCGNVLDRIHRVTACRTGKLCLRP